MFQSIDICVSKFVGLTSLKCFQLTNGTGCFKNVNNNLNTNIYSYLETSGGQSSNIYLNVVPFLTPALMRHLWQLQKLFSCTVV
jgi:hypothetical protein